MVFFSSLQVGFLTSFKPCEVSLGMKLDIFNEITTVALVDLLTVFSAANLTKFDSEADIIFLACLFGNLIVHIFFLVKTTVVSTKDSCRRR